nr:MAG TPA: Integrase [Caudoviricetes sp.]
MKGGGHIMSQRSAYGCIERVDARRYRVRWWGDLRDGKGYRRLSKTVHGSRRDARLYLSQMEAAHHEDRPTMTVQDVFDRWYWPEVSKRIAKNTLSDYRSAWRIIAPKWGSRIVTDIKPMEVQEWLHGLKASQTTRALTVLRPLMDYTVRYEMIPSNPFRVRYNVNKPADTNGKGTRALDKGVYTLEECIEIARAAHDNNMEVPIILAAFGSCRVGESLATSPSDVRVAVAGNGMICAVVHISRQLDESGARVESLKNSQSERDVVIPAPLSGRVLRAARVAYKSGYGFVSHDGMGGGIKIGKRMAWWRKAVDDAGVKFHLLRNLRNSWRTYMEWTLRVDPMKLELLMGHAGKDVSSKYYVRPTEMELVDTVAEAFSKVDFGDGWDI